MTVDTVAGTEARTGAVARTRRSRADGPGYGLTGVVAALVSFCLSLTPSLLPRSWLFQALLGGLAAALGYGLGVLAGSLTCRLARWQPAGRTTRIAWYGLAVLGPALVAFSLYMGAGWQRDIHRLMGLRESPRYHSIMIVFTALLVFACLVGSARLLRRFFCRLWWALDHLLPAQTARLAGAGTMALLVIALLHGILYQGALTTANLSFRYVSQQTAPPRAVPSAPTVSGSPGSLVSWTSLNKKGREFVTGATNPRDLQAFSQRPAMQPIRVYTGLHSAPDTDEQAALVVKELERTGAFARQVLCVVTTTGTGWVDEHAIDALEYMYNGDTAVAAMQYSYLPSVISFLVDRSAAQQAGRQLFDHVYARWSQLPQNARPKLLVFGESLGSFGSEAAFSGTDDIRNRTDGVLWAGPPNGNTLWGEFTEHRDPGTPEILPVYQQGRTVRFSAQPSDLDEPASPWTFPRIVYLQHASDPVVWWSPRLLFHEPHWLREPRGQDVLGAMHWYPVITFLQIMVDLPGSSHVPAGHGHNYGDQTVEAWADIAAPPGWTPEQANRLKSIIDG